MRIRVQDGGTPARTQTQELKVKVLRNAHAPRFTNEQTEAEVLETIAIGAQVMRVDVTDADDKEPHNDVTLSTNHAFFDVRQDGALLVRRSLLTDWNEEYRVSELFSFWRKLKFFMIVVNYPTYFDG